MTHPLRTLTIGTVIALIFVTAFAMFYTVKANPSYFYRAQSAAATTTLSYMTPGLATTTQIVDLSVNSAQGADSAAFLIQFFGSSTVSILNMTFEYSQGGNGLDCVNNANACDWYKDSLFGANIATSTTNVDLDIANNYQLTFSSSTVGIAGGNAPRTTRIIELPTPARYIRAVLSIAPGTLNGAVWSEFITKRQSN